jgi:hypothetical protein
VIVLPEKKALIITPPKCGSTSIHQHFAKEGVFVIGPQGDDGDIDKHTNKIPFDFRDFKKYIIVRNPIDRFVSLWNHYCQWIKICPLWVYQENLFSASWFYRWTLNHYDVPGAECLRLENIDQELQSRGLTDRNLPVLNQANTPLLSTKRDCPDYWWFYDQLGEKYDNT